MYSPHLLLELILHHFIVVLPKVTSKMLYESSKNMALMRKRRVQVSVRVNVWNLQYQPSSVHVCTCVCVCTAVCCCVVVPCPLISDVTEDTVWSC